MNSIFIQIASYRDPELENTIESALNNAKYPKNLKFGICRQYHPKDDFCKLKKYRKNKNFRIIDVPYNETKGTCWARNKVQQKYKGEKYTLQIDSHMRFKENWDIELIEMLENLIKLGFPKPLLTSYVSSFDPKNDPEGRVQEPWEMTFDRFIPEGAVFFLPRTIPNWRELDTPVPARFYSAHFAFTLGEFSKEVQHNPDYYFHGEEISIAVRAFTHGYDLFHPHKVLIWHEYTRKGRVKQWDDDKKWIDKNNKSHLTNRHLFGMDGLEQKGHDCDYGFGKVRTLEDYENYSGLRFKDRAVQQYTLDNKYPHNPKDEPFLNIFKHCIDLSREDLKEKDYDFWAVAFHDENDNTMVRIDATENEINRLLNSSDSYIKLWRQFNTDKIPKYWVVWTHTKSNGWGKRIKRNII